MIIVRVLSAAAESSPDTLTEIREWGLTIGTWVLVVVTFDVDHRLAVIMRRLGEALRRDMRLRERRRRVDE